MIERALTRFGGFCQDEDSYEKMWMVLTRCEGSERGGF